MPTRMPSYKLWDWDKCLMTHQKWSQDKIIVLTEEISLWISGPRNKIKDIPTECDTTSNNFATREKDCFSFYVL